jgi:hypothetical protein
VHDLAKSNFANEEIMKRCPLSERMKHGNQFDDPQMSQGNACRKDELGYRRFIWRW